MAWILLAHPRALSFSSYFLDRITKVIINPN
jgi:hypothetical protein